MAKQRTNKKAETKNEFKEFSFTMDNFDYSGRIYPVEESANGNKRAYLSLCINDQITINYCHLVITKKNTFISFPSISVKDDYKSVIYTDESLNEELDALASELEKLV